jgi:hypothetical protein
MFREPHTCTCMIVFFKMVVECDLVVLS